MLKPEGNMTADSACSCPITNSSLDPFYNFSSIIIILILFYFAFYVYIKCKDQTLYYFIDYNICWERKYVKSENNTYLFSKTK